MKKKYIQPRIDIFSACVEKGFRGSYPSGMTESITDGGYYDLGNPDPYYPDGSPMTEGISNGQTIFF